MQRIRYITRWIFYIIFKYSFCIPILIIIKYLYSTFSIRHDILQSCVLTFTTIPQPIMSAIIFQPLFSDISLIFSTYISSITSTVMLMFS